MAPDAGRVRLRTGKDAPDPPLPVFTSAPLMVIEPSSPTGQAEASLVPLTPEPEERRGGGVGLRGWGYGPCRND